MKKLVFFKIQCYKCYSERSVGVQSKRSEACPAIEDRVEGNL